VVLYTIIYEHRYMITQQPLGSFRLQLKGPAVKDRTPPSQLSYCNNSITGISSGFQLPCKYKDEHFVKYPFLEATAVMASTRVVYSAQVLRDAATGANCTVEDENEKCEYVTVGAEDAFFCAEVERFTLMIDHSMYAPRVGERGNARNFVGKIVDAAGKQMKPPKPNVIGVPGEHDILELQVLLDAAGVTLDSAGMESPEEESKRSSGLVLIVFVTYSNTDTWVGFSPVSYTYSVNVVKATEFKMYQTLLPSANSIERGLYNRHGVRMLFIQNGLLGQFDFQVLLISLVTSLGLLAASTFVVDFLAIRVLPAKRLYSNYKYKTTKKIEGDFLSANEIEPVIDSNDSLDEEAVSRASTKKNKV